MKDGTAGRGVASVSDEYRNAVAMIEKGSYTDLVKLLENTDPALLIPPTDSVKPPLAMVAIGIDRVAELEILINQITYDKSCDSQGLTPIEYAVKYKKAWAIESILKQEEGVVKRSEIYQQAFSRFASTYTQVIRDDGTISALIPTIQVLITYGAPEQQISLRTIKINYIFIELNHQLEMEAKAIHSSAKRVDSHFTNALNQFLGTQSGFAALHNGWGLSSDRFYQLAENGKIYIGRSNGSNIVARTPFLTDEQLDGFYSALCRDYGVSLSPTSSLRPGDIGDASARVAAGIASRSGYGGGAGAGVGVGSSFGRAGVASVGTQQGVVGFSPDGNGKRSGKVALSPSYLSQSKEDAAIELLKSIGTLEDNIAKDGHTQDLKKQFGSIVKQYRALQKANNEAIQAGRPIVVDLSLVTVKLETMLQPNSKKLEARGRGWSEFVKIVKKTIETLTCHQLKPFSKKDQMWTGLINKQREINSRYRVDSGHEHVS